MPVPFEIKFKHRHAKADSFMDLAAILAYLASDGPQWFFLPACAEGAQALVDFLGNVGLDETMSARPLEERTPVLCYAEGLGSIVACPKDFIGLETFKRAWAASTTDLDMPLPPDEEIAFESGSSIVTMDCGHHHAEGRRFATMLGLAIQIIGTSEGEQEAPMQSNDSPMLPGQKAVTEFHIKFGVPARPHPEMIAAEDRLRRVRLIFEEAAEFATACGKQDMPEIADAIADLLYVTFGAAVEFGIDICPIFYDVHRANMSKTGGADEGGKITKGPNFVPPDSTPFLQAQGWEG